MPATTPDLALGTRAGLPDAIAYLRALYQQPEWQGHVRFGQLAAFWLNVHASLRHHGAEVTATTRAFREGRTRADAFQRAVVPQLNGFLGHLDQHHRIEDQAYFPKFRVLDDRMVRGFDLLEEDHGVIHAGILSTVEAARALLDALARSGDARQAADGFAGRTDALVHLLDRHLADEEDLVIPALLEHGERPVT